MRPNRLSPPSVRVAVAAKICSTVSPVPWPSLSLIDLKWSRSNRNTASGSKSRLCCTSSLLAPSMKARRLGTPLKGSISEAILWCSSVRSLVMLSSRNASTTVNSSVPKASSANETPLISDWPASDRRKQRRRDARQQRRGIGQQHAHRRPARHQRLGRPRQNSSAVTAASMAMTAETKTTRRIDVGGKGRSRAGDQPERRRRQHEQRADGAAVEHPRARPGQSVAEQHQRIGEADRNPVQAPSRAS